MTNEEFLKKVDGAKGLLKDIMNHPVKVRLKSKDGITISDHFTLTNASYMFSPIITNDDGTKGAMVLEFQVE
jgi:hypothetical protein